MTLLVCSLGEEVGRLFLQASPGAGPRGAPPRARDSGYDSLHRRLSVLDRLVQTHAVWLQLGLSHHEATLILQKQPAGVSFLNPKNILLNKTTRHLLGDGLSTCPSVFPPPLPPPSRQKSDCLSSSHTQTFLVRKSTSMQRKVISVRMGHDTAPPLQDFLVRENKFSMY